MIIWACRKIDVFEQIEEEWLFTTESLAKAQRKRLTEKEGYRDREIIVDKVYVREMV